MSLLSDDTTAPSHSFTQILPPQDQPVFRRSEFAGNSDVNTVNGHCDMVGAMPITAIQLQSYPGPLEATRDRVDDRSAVLASCDPRTPDVLTVHLATMWTTTALSLPELERLLREPSHKVVIAGVPGTSGIYLSTDAARQLLGWLHRLDAERTQPPRNKPM